MIRMVISTSSPLQRSVTHIDNYICNVFAFSIVTSRSDNHPLMNAMQNNALLFESDGSREIT